MGKYMRDMHINVIGVKANLIFYQKGLKATKVQLIFS